MIMSPDDRTDDDKLLDELRGALKDDPPPEVAAKAKAAITKKTSGDKEKKH
jgi:hypothetical protein